jgi:hypothetical protein
VYETLGFWRALWLSPRWQVRKEYLVLVKDLARGETLAQPGRSPASVQWRVLSESDIGALRSANPKLAEAEARRRWREGQECLAGLVGDRLAHYRWDADRRTYLSYLKRFFDPLAGDTLVTESWTHPAFRGQGLHSLATLQALFRARDRGFSRSITMIAWWNVAAMRVGREKAGRDVAGTVGYWHLGVTTRHFATGTVRFGPAGEVYVARPTT